MEIKPKYVKIDASIVRGVHGNTGKQAMLKALHTLAKSIDAETVGEGVETAQDFEVLREFGIDYAQGYYFAKPGPPFPELNIKPSTST
jgi:EAL domain-containing protein (putative c-di-GMP-specific phosphodiesterase class I)